jgi:hypothetical protein
LRAYRASTTFDSLEALGDGGCAGVIAAGFSIGITVRVIPEFTEHGAQDCPKLWQGADDLGARVLIKTLRQLRLDPGDLGVQLGDHPDERGYRAAQS